MANRRFLASLPARALSAGLIRPRPTCVVSLQTRHFSVSKVDTRFTEDHEWITSADSEGVCTVGITDFAQQKLGDLVFVELPEIDAEFDKGDTFGTVESVKAASDLYSPVSGTVVAINDSVGDNPALVNASPETDGWLIKIKPNDLSDLDELLTADDYSKLLDQ